MFAQPNCAWCGKVDPPIQARRCFHSVQGQPIAGWCMAPDEDCFDRDPLARHTFHDVEDIVTINQRGPGRIVYTTGEAGES